MFLALIAWWRLPLPAAAGMAVPLLLSIRAALDAGTAAQRTLHPPGELPPPRFWLLPSLPRSTRRVTPFR